MQRTCAWFFLLLFCRDVYYRELIYEIKVNVWCFHCNSHKTAFKILNAILEKGIEEYPNNMCFLGTLLDLEVRYIVAN